MTDTLDELKSCLGNPSAVMSKRVVGGAIAEIERLRSDARIAVFAESEYVRTLDDDNERLRADLAAMRREADMMHGEYKTARTDFAAERETFVDERGTTWVRPTAEAYFRLCKAHEKAVAELAAARKAKMERLQTAADTIQETRVTIDKLREALEPFVASAGWADSANCADKDRIYVVVAHLRHARAVLAETKGDGDE